MKDISKDFRVNLGFLQVMTFIEGKYNVPNKDLRYVYSKNNVDALDCLALAVLYISKGKGKEAGNALGLCFDSDHYVELLNEFWPLLFDNSRKVCIFRCLEFGHIGTPTAHASVGLCVGVPHE